MMTRTLVLALATILLAAPAAFADDVPPPPPPRPDLAALTPGTAQQPAGPDLRAYFTGEASVRTDAAAFGQLGGALTYRGRELGSLLVGGVGNDLGRHGKMQFWSMLDLHPVEWLHIGGDVIGEERQRMAGNVWLGVDLQKHRREGDIFDLVFKFDATWSIRDMQFGGRLDWYAAGQIVPGTSGTLWLSARLVAWYKLVPALQFQVALEARVGSVTFTGGFTLERGELPRWVARGRTTADASFGPFLAIGWRA